MNVREIRPGLVEVTFQWHTRHGQCVECGGPAAFLGIDAYGTGDHEKLCAVCAANVAAEGNKIEWIEAPA